MSKSIIEAVAEETAKKEEELRRRKREAMRRRRQAEARRRAAEQQKTHRKQRHRPKHHHPPAREASHPPTPSQDAPPVQPQPSPHAKRARPEQLGAQQQAELAKRQAAQEAAAQAARAQEAEARRKAQEEAQRKRELLDLKAHAYVQNVFGSMQQHQPPLSPLGCILFEDRWHVSIDDKGFRAEGTVAKGFGFKSDPLRLRCRLIGQLSPKRLHQLLLRDAQAAAKRNQFCASCYVVYALTDQTASVIRSFAHPNLAVYAFDLENDTLVCNEGDTVTQRFKPWFDTSMTPLSVKELILSVADEDGMFTKQMLIDKLGLKADAVDQLTDALYKKHQIVDIDAKNWAFVRKE